VLRKLSYELERVLALVKYPFFKKGLMQVLSQRLTGLHIETTNVCNANCIFCAYQHQQRPKGVMSWDLFRKVVDEFCDCGGGPVNLTPTVGDPLVDPLLLERLRYANNMPQIRSLAMYSNMISLGRVGARALVESGLKCLVVSMSGFDEGMYLRLYRSKMYRQVISNIKAFAAANREKGGPVDFWLSLSVDRPLSEVFCGSDYEALAQVVPADHISVKLRYDDWGGKIQPHDLSGTMRLRSAYDPRFPKVSPCAQLFSGLAVYWDGKVGACSCRDVDARELIVGDATRSHLRDIWFGNEIRRLREEWLSASTRRDICKNCLHYNNLSVYLRRSNRKMLRRLVETRSTAESGFEGVN
jgi:MoaA/NifB/PqqE/SkfB family radical SAM enzyme